MNASSSQTPRAIVAFAAMAGLLLIVGFAQSWSLAFTILNLCIISAVMALGVNIQWGYAGLFNVGIMGFAALGGVAAMLVSKAPVGDAWAAGGGMLALAAIVTGFSIFVIWYAYRYFADNPFRNWILAALVVVCFFAIRYFYDPMVMAVEATNPAKTGYLGGLGLPIILSWAVGGVFAAGAAWLVGKIALGLRADYLAIATLGISEIIVAMLKNEDWLTRGVKNVTGLSRPVPYEVDLQQSQWFRGWVEWFYHGDLVQLTGDERYDALQSLVIDSAGITVKLSYTCLFAAVLIIVLALCVLALDSPWGRMIRAIRDNEISAGAMGKNVTSRHLQIFVLGSAVVGIAGAMLTTLDGQFIPTTYNPLRYTFLIWVMVIVGGSGNNLGSVLGGFLIWFVWIEAEPVGNWLMDVCTLWLGDGNPVREHLLDAAQHMRLFVMGLVLLIVMRFSPGGILPERVNHG